MVISYNLDPTTHTSKPTGAEIGKIRNRLKPGRFTPEQLLEQITSGATFTPALMNGTTADTWQMQQIFVIDFDNDGSSYLQEDDALAVLRHVYDIDPFCMYHTFSHRDDHPKYRAVIITSDAITDPDESKDLTLRLAECINSEYDEPIADTAVKDNARLIFGSTANSIFYKSGKITPLETLRKLPHLTAASENVANIAQAAADAVRSQPERHTSTQGRFDLLEPLSYIPADDYDTWIKCGMALHFEQYTVYDWIEWSRTSSKFKDGLCESKWRSFTDDGARTVTGAYITDLAKKYGYIPPRERRQNDGGQYLDWNDTIQEPGDFERTDDDAPPITAPTATPEPTAPAPIQPEPSPLDALEEFKREIMTTRFEPIKTGIDQLDAALQGGLERRTLVTLAAAPGAGKTAISQYILENMAYNDHPVIYVNLEMDRSQLLSRSLSRISHKMKIINILDEDMTALQVKRGYKWTNEQKPIFEWCFDYYQRHIAPNFYYVTTNPENIGAIDNKLSSILAKIEKITAELQEQGKEPPLVCIDYLQFIDFDMYEGNRKPDNADAIKQTLNAFKQFAMAHDTCVLVITANNRASNSDGRASMDSARDTSNIEYSGDVMLSLVYTAVEERWKHRSGKKDRDGNDTPALIDNEFVNNCVDYAKKMHQPGEDNYPLIAKLLSLKVVKGRSIETRGAAKFVYDGRYFYFEDDHGHANPYWYEEDIIEPE